MEKVQKHNTKTIIFRQTKDTDFDKLNQDLSEAPWHVGDIFSDSDDKYDYWKGLVEYVVNDHAPIRRKRGREKDIPYMTVEWKQAIRNKRKYAIRNEQYSGEFELKKKHRNIASQERRKAIKAYWLQKSEEIKTRPNEFYNTFRPFISSKTKESNSICLQSEGGEIDKDPTALAERLASYFKTAAESIGGDHVSSLTESDLENHSSVRAINDTFKDTLFDFQTFSKEEVQDALEKINPKKSCGWDPRVSPKQLQMIASGVAQSLTSLYNSRIVLSQWPTAWKKGQWTTVFKKGDRQEEKNYCPTTSLISVDKIFEQSLSNQITGHYDTTLYHRMTAYRKTYSFEATLPTLVEEWKLEAMDRRELVTILSTDMSKAFDSLCPALTRKKLEAYGFGNRSLDLMRSFFDGRLNRVKINGHTSEWKTMTRGCPQSTAFGLLLWNIFQNDMADHVNVPNLSHHVR